MMNYRVAMLSDANATSTDEEHAAARPTQSDLASRIASYELAYRMQMAAPEALDIASESEATHKLYGMDNPECATFSRQCLIARRLVDAHNIGRVIARNIVDADTVRNQFLVRIVNKRNEPVRFRLELRHVPEDICQTGFDTAVQVEGMGELVQPLIVQQRRKGYVGPFHFEMRLQDSEGTLTLNRTVEFLGPEARLLREEGIKP